MDTLKAHEPLRRTFLIIAIFQGRLFENKTVIVILKHYTHVAERLFK